MIDYHIHTRHSVDAQGTLNEYAKQALKLGLKEICITNHCELDPARNDNLIRLEDEKLPLCRENLLTFAEEIFQIKDYYQKRGLKIKFGLEVGYFTGVGRRLREIIYGLQLDYLLAGIHCLDHICIDSSKECERYFSQKCVDDLLFNYHKTLKELVESKDFDAVAHLDVYKKYGFQFYGEKIKKIPEDILRQVFKSMSKNGIALEINTAGLRRYGEFYPSGDIMKIANEEGIELVTIGSDCHRIEDLGKGIREAIEYAHFYNLKYLLTFEGRRPKPLLIKDLLGSH